jgi:hypothetical protein
MFLLSSQESGSRCYDLTNLPYYGTILVRKSLADKNKDGKLLETIVGRRCTFQEAVLWLNLRPDWMK